MRRIIMLILLVSSIIANIIFATIYISNKSYGSVNINEIASSQSIKSYVSRYIPDMIANLYTISIYADRNEKFDSIDYYDSYVKLVSATASVNAVIGIPDVYQSERYMELSIVMNSFSAFISDAQEVKIKYVVENSKVLIGIFEDLLINVENSEEDRLSNNCVQLMELINNYLVS